MKFQTSGNQVIDDRLRSILSRYDEIKNKTKCKVCSESLLRDIQDFRYMVGYNKATESYESVYHWSTMLDSIIQDLKAGSPS
jgi:hypothetical protein